MKYYQVGKIVNTFGIKGELKVLNESDFDRFKVGNTLYIKDNEQYQKITIDSVRFHKGQVLISVNGYKDINEVLKYVGKDIYVLNPPKMKDVYYVDDIVGLDVYDMDNNKIGIVLDVLIMPKANLLQIKQENEEECLIPNVSEFVKKVDLENHKIMIQPIEGMLK